MGGVRMAMKRVTEEKLKIAERLRYVRKTIGDTQENFANKLDISESAYKKLEGAENNLSLNVIRELKKQNISADYILFGEEKAVEELWEMVCYSSEDKKMELLIRLVRHFVEKGGGQNSDQLDSMVEKLITAKDIQNKDEKHIDNRR